MSISNYITLALFAVIGLIFLIDFIKNNSKKSIDISVEKFEEKGEVNKGFIYRLLSKINPKNFSFIHLIGQLYCWISLYINYLNDGLSFEEAFYAVLGEIQSPIMWTVPLEFLTLTIILHSLFFIFYKNRYWILKRKKNITISIILILLLKVLVHYFFYPIKGINAKASFGFHLDAMFWPGTLNMFIPVTIVFLILVWFFNDKIKAQ